MLISVGKDNKIFVIDVSLNTEIERMLTKVDQRLETKYKQTSYFESGFFVLGYLGEFSSWYSEIITIQISNLVF